MLKLGAGAALLGTASLTGWIGLAMRLADGGDSRAPISWADLSVISLSTLILTVIAGFMAWVMLDLTRSDRRIDG